MSAPWQPGTRLVLCSVMKDGQLLFAADGGTVTEHAANAREFEDADLVVRRGQRLPRIEGYGHPLRRAWGPDGERAQEVWAVRVAEQGPVEWLAGWWTMAGVTRPLPEGAQPPTV